jgi:hypothetical protein
VQFRTGQARALGGWSGERGPGNAKAGLGERNTNLRSFPPSHAATADGCVVKHKIECIGNSDVTFHIKAGAQVRQVADRTIDRRPVTFEDDARPLESAAAARFIPEFLLPVIHLFDLPATRALGLRHGA